MRVFLVFVLILGAFLCGCTGLHHASMHPSEYLDIEGQRIFQQAKDHFAEGDHDQAGELLQELLLGYPECFRVHRLLQEITIRNEGNRRAAELAEEVCRLDETPLTLTLWARASSDPEEKIKLLKKALTLDESYVWAHFGLAYVYLKEGRVEDFENARFCLEEALKYAPQFNEARLLMIENLHRLGEYEEEGRQYIAYLDAVPEDSDIRYNYAMLLSGQLDDPDEALTQLELILDDDPGRIDALLLKGAVLCQLDELREAEGHFVEMSDLHPNALLNLGILYKDYLDEPAKAKDCFQRYLEYSGRHADEKSFYDQKILVPNSLEILSEVKE